MPVRTDEEVREALEAQAHDNANAGELLDILRWSSSGNAAQKRARLLSFLDGPASRRRAGWLDLLLQVHAAGATSFNDLEPDELEIDDEDRGGDDDARLPVGSVSVLLDLVVVRGQFRFGVACYHPWVQKLREWLRILNFCH